MEDLCFSSNLHSFHSVSCFNLSPHLLPRSSHHRSLTQLCCAPSTSTHSSTSVIHPPVCVPTHLLRFTSIMLSMNVLLPASIRLPLSRTCPRLSIHIDNAVYVLLPIMLSISVCLLLAGWKGVRGGLSQLIYHIKYQPSSALSFSFPLFKHPSLLSLLFFTSSYLHLSFSLVPSSFFYQFFNLPVKVPVSFPHTSPSKPLGNFFPLLVKVHISRFSQQLPYAFAPHLTPALLWPSVPNSLSPSPGQALFPNHIRFAEVQCLITQKRAAMQGNFFTDHNNGFWQCGTLTFWR